MKGGVTLLALALAGCACPPSGPAGFDARGALRVLPRPPRDAIAADGEALIPGIRETEFFAIRSAEELAAARGRLGLPGLFAGIPVDFRTQMVFGVVSAPTRKKVGMHIYRVLAHGDHLEVQAVAFPRGEAESERTPYFFGRFPRHRADAPVRFHLNDALAGVVPRDGWAPGLHREALVRSVPYAVYVPAGLKGPAPLVVFLHGSTTNGDAQMDRFAAAAERLGFVVLGVTNRNGYYWTEDRDYPSILDAIVAVRSRCAIDPSRIYVGGASAGGHTAYVLGLSRRDLFAGIFSLCGRLNPEVPDAVVADAEGVPVFIMSGDADEIVPIRAVVAGKERLERAGADVALRVIPGGGHRAPLEPGNMRHLFEWLEARLSGAGSGR